ncbi:hypothetical protein EBU02_12030 [bacterium]|nr:hypothetical protein [bacterium]
MDLHAGVELAERAVEELAGRVGAAVSARTLVHTLMRELGVEEGGDLVGDVEEGGADLGEVGLDCGHSRAIAGEARAEEEGDMMTSATTMFLSDI